MDSVTQFTLGAALGVAVLRRRESADSEGRRTFRWGAFWLGGLFGTLPDLDVLVRPFLNGTQALGFHRGITHSVFLCTLVTPLLAALLARLFPNHDVSRRRWLAFVWLTLNTHWVLDALTTYGTQVFLPFSNYPVNIGSLFIVDPFYTVPLLCGVLLTLISSRRDGPYRPQPLHLGLALSTGYLLFSLLSKAVVWQRLHASARAEGLQPQQLISVATPFNCLLWYGLADTGDAVWVADASLLDPSDRPIRWQRISKQRELVPDFGVGPAEQRLLWFSRGFYRLERVGDQIVFFDLRFGRAQGWLRPIPPEGDDYIFRFALLPPGPRGPYQDFERWRPQGRLGQMPWRDLRQRLLGRSLEEPGLTAPSPAKDTTTEPPRRSSPGAP